jgi:hypothetical protein
VADKPPFDPVKAAFWLSALFLAGCADGVEPWTPPVVATYAFRPGEQIVCEETLVRIGLPTVITQVIGFGKRTWNCRLVRDKP